MEIAIPTRASIVILDFIRMIKENPNVNPVLKTTPPLSRAPRTVQTACVSDSIYSIMSFTGFVQLFEVLEKTSRALEKPLKKGFCGKLLENSLNFGLG